MAFGSDRQTSFSRAADSALIDEGLRSYMLRVYNYMATGLALTGLVAYMVANTPCLRDAIFGTPLMWVVMLAPLSMVLYLGAKINSMSVRAAQTSFWIFSTLMGMSLASIFVIYTGTSIARVFFITSGVFGAMSLYGYTTKRSLAGWGSFLFMGVIGIIIAMVVNMFMASTAMQFAISVIGVLIFTALTAYDTQKLKLMYVQGDGTATAEKKAIMGALTLYLDFINLFMFLLMLFGNRR